MSLLAQIEYEREEYVRYDDFAAYATHLSKKLHALRKSQSKLLEVALFSAERVWANAQHNKSVNGKVQVTMNKLRKACKYARQVKEQVEDATHPSSDVTKLEATLYADLMQGLVAQERQAYQEAMLLFSKCLVAIQESPSSSLKDAAETGLRYAIYSSVTEDRTVNLLSFAIDQVTSSDSEDNQVAWRKLVEKVNPKALQKEAHGDEMIQVIEWANRSARLTNPELASAVSTAMSLRTSTPKAASANGFDNIIGAWSDASLLLESALAAEEDQNAAQELELIKVWISYQSSQDSIKRDKVLVKATTNPREGVALWDKINRTYAQVIGLPGLSEADRTAAETARQEGRGERCVLLAKQHGNSLEAIALLDRSLHYYPQNLPSPASQTRRSEIEALLNQAIAKHTLSADTSFSLAHDQWYTDNVKKIPHLQAKDLAVKTIAPKPVVFDIAFNYISPLAPPVSSIGQDATAKEPEKKSLFGFLSR